ncbi:MAG: hypothetical protein HYV19_08870 [Gemmatimonadetes bacterium]|nr:hypothetical protein [Gemmatimonadota bacterium]
MMTVLSHTLKGQPPSDAVPDTKAQRELQALLTRTESARKKRNIERIWAALEDMRARAERVYNVASVARAVARLGYSGPKYQSMRNKEGADFRALINAYREVHGAVVESRDATDADEDLPLAITDVAIQQRVRIELRRVRALQERNRILHEEVVRLSRAALATAPTAAPVAAGELVFTLDEVRAVEHFLAHMEAVGLRPDEATGCILEQRGGREVAPPYFLDALRRIVSTSRHPGGDG